MVEKKAFSEEFKRMVVKAYYASDKSAARIGKEFNVNTSTVAHWITRFRSEFAGDVSLRQEIRTFSSVTNTDLAVKKKLSPEQMEQRILELEKRLEQEQMRSTVLDKMIDLAEQDLKISIRKKSGAKQSK